MGDWTSFALGTAVGAGLVGVLLALLLEAARRQHNLLTSAFGQLANEAQRRDVVEHARRFIDSMDDSSTAVLPPDAVNALHALRKGVDAATTKEASQ